MAVQHITKKNGAHPEKCAFVPISELAHILSNIIGGKTHAEITAEMAAAGINMPSSRISEALSGRSKFKASLFRLLKFYAPNAPIEGPLYAVPLDLLPPAPDDGQ